MTSESEILGLLNLNFAILRIPWLLQDKMQNEYVTRQNEYVHSNLGIKITGKLIFTLASGGGD